MARRNQIIVDHDYDDYVCVSCDDRGFSSATSLFQHCRTSKLHRGEWCERCEWLFVNPQARTAHVQNSSSHSYCSFCHRDLADDSELISHLAKIHLYCSQCQVTFSNYTKHRFEAHHRCRECYLEFANNNELKMHLQVHLPRSQECYGCTKKFPLESAILDHLEYNTCASGVTLSQINEWAFACYQHKHYTNNPGDSYKYRCPSCDTNFKYVSALLRHAESGTCYAESDRSLKKLKHYIMTKVDRYSSS